jgi:hypothetical protein
MTRDDRTYFLLLRTEGVETFGFLQTRDREAAAIAHLPDTL